MQLPPLQYTLTRGMSNKKQVCPAFLFFQTTLLFDLEYLLISLLLSVVHIRAPMNSNM